VGERWGKQQKLLCTNTVSISETEFLKQAMEASANNSYNQNLCFSVATEQKSGENSK